MFATVIPIASTARIRGSAAHPLAGRRRHWRGKANPPPPSRSPPRSASRATVDISLVETHSFSPLYRRGAGEPEGPTSWMPAPGAGYPSRTPAPRPGLASPPARSSRIEVWRSGGVMRPPATVLDFPERREVENARLPTRGAWHEEEYGCVRVGNDDVRSRSRGLPRPGKVQQGLQAGDRGGFHGLQEYLRQG